MPSHVARGGGSDPRPRVFSHQLAGLSGETDWALMPRIVEGNFTFVTNNARNFRKL